MADRGFLSIGEVLALLKPEFADLTISKIRFLESQGLLDPERTPSGYRKFYGPDVERLRWILQQQHENYLPLKVIKGKLGTEPDAASEQGTDPGAPGASGKDGGPDGRAAQTGAGGSAGASARPAPGSAMAGVDHPERSESRAAGRPRKEAVPPARAGLSRQVPARGSSARAIAGGTLTAEELEAASEISAAELAELVRYGLVAGKTVAGTVYYDDDALAVARLSAAFMRYGVEARHLRMYRTAAEREASFFEQVVMPLLKQRNPQARQRALDALEDLAQLGQGLRAAMVRLALREYTGP